MAQWFWYFLIYSLLGYCLEKLFARAVRSDRQVRKCFLFLPLCPVYGLAMLAVIALHDPQHSFLVQAMWGGALCTAAEYLVHLFYDKFFQTKFWDYSALRFHINGRVCPQFSLAWGLLSAGAVRFIHPVIAASAAAIPPEITLGVWVFLAADCVFTASLLRRYHNTELLSLAVFTDQQRSSSQSSTSR